jgi:hypothetical protein
MRYILCILTLYSLPTPLIAMQLTTLPNNFCAKMYWYIKNIDESFHPNHRLHDDIKQQLYNNYFALTEQEFKWGKKYLKLVDVADYIPLNSSNKRTIRYLRNKHKTINLPNEDKKVIVIKPTFNDHLFYQELLALPYDIRRKLANEYSSNIFIKTNLSIPHEEQFLVYPFIIGTALGMIPAYYFYTHPTPQDPSTDPNKLAIANAFLTIITSGYLGAISELLHRAFFTHKRIIQQYQANGYELKALVPENQD